MDYKINLKFRFINSSDSSCELLVEPWGEAYQLPAGARYWIHIYSNTDGHPDLQIKNQNTFGFYAWDDALITIFDENDNELTPKRVVS